MYGALPVAGVVASTPTERAARARVPAHVRAIIARAMAARPADRFQTAQAMRDVLLDERTPRLGMISFSPNGRWLAACGGSRDRDGAWRVALLAADGTTQTLLDSADAVRTSCGVIWSARGDSPHVWPTTPGTGMTSYAIDDASGKVIGAPTPFRLPPSAGGERTSFSLSADEKRLTYVEHSVQRYAAVAELGAGIDVPSRIADVGSRDPSQPTISPTGDRFAYVVTDDSGCAIYARDMTGGEPRRLARDYREGLSGVRWSEDATRIATLTRRDSRHVILILDAIGTEVMAVRTRHTVYDTSFSRPGFDFAARGTAIMYNTLNPAKRRPEVWLIDLASGRERLLLAAENGFSSRRLSLPVWSPDGTSILYDSLGVLIIEDAATGTRRAAPPSGGAVTPCRMPQQPPCEKGTIVPLRWRADGTYFSQRINRDGSTTIWRSTMSRSPTLYAHLPKECKLVSIDRDAHGAVCEVSRDESDVFLVTRP